MNTDTLVLLDKYFDLAITAPDGIKRLREMILTLAMQGKLVPQDPNDPPASELLKEIEAEKKRLVEDGKIKESKPLPPIKPDEFPHQLPNGWEFVRLGNICRIIRGITFPSSEKTKEEHKSRIACLRTANVQSEIEWDDLLFIDREYMTTEDKILQKDDLVISMANSRELVGKVAIINELPYPEATFGGFLSIIRTNQINARYLLAIFRSSFIRNKLIDSASQTTNIANISLGKLNPLLIPLPPLPEQRRIVAKIDELMARVDELERKRDARNERKGAMHQAAVARLLDACDAGASRRGRDFIFAHFADLYGTKENVAELRKAILQLAVMGRLVPQDPKNQPASELLKEIEAEKKRLVQEGTIKEPKPIPPIKPEEVPYQLPENWEWVRMREIGHDWGQKEPQSEFTYIDVGSVDNRIGKISSPQILSAKEAPSRARKIVHKGTVIYSTVRPYLLNIAVIENEFNPEPISSTAFAIIHPYDGICTWYIYYYLHAPSFVSYVESTMKGVAYPAINDGDFFKALFPLPPLHEQQRIVAKVDELMSLCDQLEKRIDERTAKGSALLEAVAARV